MTRILVDLPNWIQAAAAGCIVALTGWTLKVLREYARDTKRIADDSSSQAERAQMPYLTVLEAPEGYVMHNQGFGPALNIRYRGHHDNVERRGSAQGLAVGGTTLVHNEYTETMNAHGEFEIEYQSLSGKGYRTVIALGHKNQVHARFFPIRPE